MTKRPYVGFKPVDPPKGAAVAALLGAGFATPTADGGWAVVTRPRHAGMTEWQGPNPITMDIPIVLDGLRENRSVEPQVIRLYEMMLQRVGERNEPVVIQVTGIPLPFHGLHWNINGIAPGSDDDAEVRRSSDGHRVRAAMTITLQQYIPGKIVVHSLKSSKTSPAKTSKNKSRSGGANGGHTGVRIIEVRDGDTLSKIAARDLGKASLWPKIAKLNNLRDPDFITPGEKLKIPKT